MQALDDMPLLREYAAHGSEAAFAELVSRRIGFVYSAALRQLRDPNLAEEATQAVFILLAQKAGRISARTILTGWLFKTTRFVALAQMRASAKRRQREQEAHMQSELHAPAPDPLWEQMSPLLDEALASLGEKDRQALLLRFFENKSLAEVGGVLGAGEDTARKRVSRALDKLRKYFSKRGVNSTTAIIAGSISANSVQVPPLALAKSVTTIALAKGAAASGSTLTVVKGALKLMAWAKAKTAVKEIEEHQGYQWQVAANDINEVLYHAPPMVKILPTRFSTHPKFFSGGATENFDVGNTINTKRLGLDASVESMIFGAYDFDSGSARAILPQLPQERYDFIVSLPRDSSATLAQEIKRKFGFVARRETIETNALLLVVGNPNAQGLKPSTSSQASGYFEFGRYRFYKESLSQFATYCEGQCNIPVIDETGLTNNFDIDFKWQSQKGESEWDGTRRAIRDQLGLELVPTNMPIEMLVVEKVK
ncbi:MAG: TIGR03435 family protein [Verrucomicrobiota bacterium]|jgi:uncharacterized protein (TIGR03435 family)